MELCKHSKRSHPLLRLLAAGESGALTAPRSTKNWRAAAATCAKSNLILLLENEMACNTATGEEAAAVSSRPQQELHAQLGSGECRGSQQYSLSRRLPLLPFERIGLAPKDVFGPREKYEWAPWSGVVDWVANPRLRQDAITTP